MASTLRVFARGTALVPNFEAFKAGDTRRFVGRSTELVLAGDVPTGLKFTPVDEPETVPFRAEYRQAVKDGSLWAADHATASACGVTFDPNFGGEHPLSLESDD